MLPESRRYTLVDYATIGYVAIVGLIVLFLHGTAVPHWGTYVAVHAGCILMILGLIELHHAYPDSRVLEFVRRFYPMFLYGPFYGETASLNHVIFNGFLDPTFLRFESHWLGYQPSVEFMNRAPYLLVSEVFYASYFSYYLMIAGVAMALYLRNRRQFAHYVTVMSLVFYVCYLCYILIPVVGPMILANNIPGYQLPADLAPAAALSFPHAVEVGPFYRLMAMVYVPFEAPGASFPSSHVAISILTVYFSFCYLPRIRWAHLVVMLLLCASTVYCRYHYITDVAAGVFTSVLLIPLANWMYWRSEPAAAPVPVEAIPSPARPFIGPVIG